MGNKFQVKVDESIEELKHRLCHAVTSSTKERVQMLYWIKQSAIATRKELSQKIGRDESTIDLLQKSDKKEINRSVKKKKDDLRKSKKFDFGKVQTLMWGQERDVCSDG